MLNTKDKAINSTAPNDLQSTHLLLAPDCSITPHSGLSPKDHP